MASSKLSKSVLSADVETYNEDNELVEPGPSQEEASPKKSSQENSPYVPSLANGDDGDNIEVANPKNNSSQESKATVISLADEEKAKMATIKKTQTGLKRPANGDLKYSSNKKARMEEPSGDKSEDEPDDDLNDDDNADSDDGFDLEDKNIKPGNQKKAKNGQKQDDPISIRLEYTSKSMDTNLRQLHRVTEQEIEKRWKKKYQNKLQKEVNRLKKEAEDFKVTHRAQMNVKHMERKDLLEKSDKKVLELRREIQTLTNRLAKANKEFPSLMNENVKLNKKVHSAILMGVGFREDAVRIRKEMIWALIKVKKIRGEKEEAQKAIEFERKKFDTQHNRVRELERQRIDDNRNITFFQKAIDRKYRENMTLQDEVLNLTKDVKDLEEDKEELEIKIKRMEEDIRDKEGLQLFPNSIRKTTEIVDQDNDQMKSETDSHDIIIEPRARSLGW